jgi:hypothetical protein
MQAMACMDALMSRAHGCAGATEQWCVSVESAQHSSAPSRSDIGARSIRAIDVDTNNFRWQVHLCRCG